MDEIGLTPRPHVITIDDVPDSLGDGLVPVHLDAGDILRTHKRVFQIAGTGTRENLFRSTVRHYTSVRDDDNVVAKCADFLHHVTGEQYAATFFLQSTDHVPECTRSSDA